eukprot:TRINITY_DN91732_c0_g1_i1.p1 TRINITY_DN91732_c0_g1~~TRINITY_DN91732_c0_g1_i1.p1  ORF type:complete len:521 (+),score=116.60 TRINITY_DN91732_c0_g1_i1:108-1670(+)
MQTWTVFKSEEDVDDPDLRPESSREGLCRCCSGVLECFCLDPIGWLKFGPPFLCSSTPQFCTLCCCSNGTLRTKALIKLMQRMTYYVSRSMSNMIALQKATDVAGSLPFYRNMRLNLKGSEVDAYDAVEAMGGGEWLYPIHRGTPQEELARPAHERRFIFYIHGGAFVLCNPATHRAITVNLVRLTSAPLLVATYTRPPEAQFGDYEGPLEQVKDAYLALAKKMPPSRIIVMGESAGGNLAAALCLKLVQERQPLPGGLILISPWVDLTDASFEKQSWHAGTDYLPVDLARKFARLYIPEGAEEHPLASPLQAKMEDLASMPQTLLIYGGDEALADQDEEFGRKLLHAKGYKDVEVYPAPEMVHAFPILYDLGHGSMGQRCACSARILGGMLLAACFSWAVAVAEAFLDHPSVKKRWIFIPLAILSTAAAVYFFYFPPIVKYKGNRDLELGSSDSGSDVTDCGADCGGVSDEEAGEVYPQTKLAYEKIVRFAEQVWGTDAGGQLTPQAGGRPRGFSYFSR